MKDRKEKCFIDFDGTIVDNSKRLYSFFQNNIPSKYKDVLSIDEFWQLKRLSVNEIEWINRRFGENISISEFIEKKKKEIESNEYLKYELLLPKSKDALGKLSERYQLILVSRRDNKEGIISEIKRFDLMEFFDDMIIVDHGDMTKSEAIRNCYEVLPTDIMVGDTEDDIAAGLELKCNTYLVLSGIRGKWIVSNYSEKIHVVNDISEIPLI